MTISRRTLLAVPGALWLSGCKMPEIEAAHAADDPAFAAIERGTGGRVGAVLLSNEGRIVASHRADERFAMCSTFKAPLAAAMFEAHDAGTLDRFAEISVSKKDLVPYAPFTEKLVESGRKTTLDQLSRQAVEISDNAAANIVLRALGGPSAFTAFCRRHDDGTTRLDRYETDLNENAVGDPRDTTSPAAMARLMHDLLLSDDRNVAHSRTLTEWMLGVRTGQNRIRAGVPGDWKVGDKTGTAPQSAPAYNDIAVLMPPGRAPYILTVYLDRPVVKGPEADAAIASVARHAAEIILATEPQV